jgi:hypothetical protein
MENKGEGMKKNSSNEWHRIWANRVLSESDPENTLEYLIELNGFDTPFGAMKAQDWTQYVHTVSNRLNVLPGDNLFEVGCGSGAFLYPFYVSGHPVGGVDYSASLIQAAWKFMPASADCIHHQSAIELETHNRYDHMVANHVFHYFEDMEYCRNVLAKMLLKARRNVLIAALPNAATMRQSEEFRRAQMPQEEYNKKYKDLGILYFNMQDLEDQAEAYGYSATFNPHQMPGFAQNHLRFDCLLTRKQQ